MELEETELQEILEREHLDLEGFLIQGTSVGVDSLPQEELNRIQQVYLWKTQEKSTEGTKNRSRLSSEGVKMIKSTLGLAPRNLG